MAAWLSPSPEALDPAADRGAERAAMVAEQLQVRDIRDARVLAAMATVPRHRFVPEGVQAEAYADCPLPIGHGQTISQPYIVALMTELLGLRPTDRVLEIGTGCGYQTAVLAALVREVCTVERVEGLARTAGARLAALGMTRSPCGWATAGRAGRTGPFDGILVTAAPDRLPAALGAQLAPGGRLVIPLGGRPLQWLHRFTREADGCLRDEELIPVRFVPLV
ncbi:MAG: protein-L-isoaspartate(D-aspartate) O-methyltransferase [Opitutaceae bacterium]|nr:protein-L-isoaspartate(D-aspartate) O-methyltransferase [Opitutaceae bacterium]